MRRLVIVAALAAAPAAAADGGLIRDSEGRFPGHPEFMGPDTSRRIQPMPDPASHARAGFPTEVKPHAVPIKTPYFMGGYTGGGRLATPKRQDGRRSVDGTWGYDYVLFGRRPGRVFLDYWHARPNQPEYGTYTTDGPHVPDPLAAHYIQKFLTGKGEGGEEGEGH